MRPDDLSVQLERLDAELTRVERRQARGVSVIQELEALTEVWRDVREAAGARYVPTTHADRLERFREQASASKPWEA